MEADSSEEAFAFTTFHPDRSYLCENGTLTIPAGGFARGFGVWDGHVVVEPSHPNYHLWLWIRSQPKWQVENAIVRDRDLDSLRREFAASASNKTTGQTADSN